MSKKMDRELLDFTLMGQGISIVPTVPRTKAPPRGFPLGDFFEGKRRATLTELAEWVAHGYDRAAVAGECSAGLVVLDFDSGDALNNFFDRGVESVAEETFTVRTRRGYSVWVKDPNAKVASAALNFRPVLEAELLLSHHLVSCPLNTHPSGFVYEGPLGSETVQRKDGFVMAVLDRMRSLGYVRKMTSFSGRGILAGVPLGKRNDSAFRYARYLLFEVGLDNLAVLNELRRWNLLNHPPLPEKEIENVIKSAINYPKKSTEHWSKVSAQRVE